MLNIQTLRAACVAKRPFWLSLAGALLVILLDQGSKCYALAHLALHQPQQVLPVLNWTLAFNTGAAFSFLASSKGVQHPLFIVLAVVVSAGIIVWLYRLTNNERLLRTGLCLVLGGALGNLVDRLRLGAVVDFIQLHYHQYYWPVFNLADSAICVGALLLIIDALLDARKAV